MDSATITNNQCVASFAITDHGSRLISRPPRSGMFINGIFQEQQSHFLDACFLCKKPLGCNRDIFMYRGDIPFCSVECREEQMEFDETKEKKRSFSASMKSSRKKEEIDKSSNSSPNYPFRSGAVVAA